LSKLKTKCPKIDVGWDSTPDPIRGTYSAPPKTSIWIFVSLLLRFGDRGGWSQRQERVGERGIEEGGEIVQLKKFLGICPDRWRRRICWQRTHHVVVESGRVGIYERDEFFHRVIQRLQQPPHLVVEMMKLLVAVRQKSHHRAQRRTLQRAKLVSKNKRLKCPDSWFVAGTGYPDPGPKLLTRFQNRVITTRFSPPLYTIPPVLGWYLHVFTNVSSAVSQ